MCKCRIDVDGHVVMGPSLSDSKSLAIYYDSNGRAKPGVIVRAEKPEGKCVQIEPCHASGRDDVFHIKKGQDKRGPGKWNSGAYCEGWEKIFGKKAKSDPSTLN